MIQAVWAGIKGYNKLKNMHDQRNTQRMGSVAMESVDSADRLVSRKGLTRTLGGVGLATALITVGIWADFIDIKTETDITHGKSTLVGVEAFNPLVCTWQFDTQVEGAKAKFTVETDVDIPNGIPLLPDEINVTPGLWASTEFNGVVRNKVCIPAGKITATKNSETGKYDLAFSPENTDEKPFKLIPLIDPGQPQIEPGKPLHISDSGGSWAAGKALEWAKNKLPLFPDTHDGDGFQQYTTAVVDYVAMEDSTACINTAWGYANEAVSSYLTDMWVQTAQSIDPTITAEDTTMELPQTIGPDDFSNEYDTNLDKFKESDYLKITNKPPQQKDCENGVEINEKPRENR